MKLEKAVQILDNHQCDMPRHKVPDLIAAIKLGIEALKRIQDSRKLVNRRTWLLLPGETESPS